MSRPDLRRLLDDVAMRATRIEIIIDARLEQSVAATVHTDRHGDAAAVLTRYAADSATEALEAVLVDAAVWSNARSAVRRPISVDHDDAIAKLCEVAEAMAVKLEGVDPALADYARAAIAAAGGGR